MAEVVVNIPTFPDVAAPLPADAVPQSSRQTSEQLRASRLSPAQADDLLAALTELGIPQERLRAAAAASGVVYTPDTRNPAEKSFDASAGTPPSNDAYRLAWRSTDITEPELAGVDGTAREWLGQNLFPGDGDPHGPALVEEAIDTIRATRGMRADELAHWQAEQDATLERIAKKNGTTGADMRAAIQPMLDVPGDFAKLLHDRPLSASFIVNAHFQARRIVVRAGLGKT